MTQKLKNRIQKMTFQKQKVRRDKVDINDDIKIAEFIFNKKVKEMIQKSV